MQAVTDSNKMKLPGSAGKERNYPVSKAPGLRLRILPKGHRTWTLRYSADGKQRMATLGDAEDIPVAEARKMAIEFKANVQKGNGPADTEAEKRSWTFDKLADAYFEKLGLEADMGGMKHASIAKYRQTYDDHLKKRIGHLRVCENDNYLAMESVMERLDKGIRNCTKSILNQMFKIAQKKRVAQHNPMTDIKRAKRKRRKTRLTKEQRRAVGAALNAMEAEGHNPIHLDCLRALMLIGSRRGEMMKLKWEHVDFDTMIIQLDEFKGDQSEDDEKPIIITSALLKILKRREQHRINEYIFPAVKRDACKADPYGTTHIKNLHKPFKAALARAGLDPTKYRPHDLRRTFAGTSKNKGYSVQIAQDAL